MLSPPPAAGESSSRWTYNARACTFHLAPLSSLLPCRQQFEVDFISLSFCNCVEDLYATRALLDSLGLNQTKIIAKARWVVLSEFLCCRGSRCR